LNELDCSLSEFYEGFILNNRFFGLLSVFMLFASVVTAKPYFVDATHSDISFKVRHLGVSYVNGQFSDISGRIFYDANAPKKSSFDGIIKVASINTNNPKRDAHLKSADFFDVEKFPEMTFKSTKVTHFTSNSITVVGHFTMNGVTKEITLPFTILGPINDATGQPRIGFECELEIDRTDYNLTYNKILEAGHLMIGNKVRLFLSLQAK